MASHLDEIRDDNFVCQFCGAERVRDYSYSPPSPWWLALSAWGASCLCAGLLGFLWAYLVFGVLGDLRYG